MELVDKLGQTTRIDFSGLKRNATLDDESVPLRATSRRGCDRGQRVVSSVPQPLAYRRLWLALGVRTCPRSDRLEPGSRAARPDGFRVPTSSRTRAPTWCSWCGSPVCSRGAAWRWVALALLGMGLAARDRAGRDAHAPHRRCRATCSRTPLGIGLGADGGGRRASRAGRTGWRRGSRGSEPGGRVRGRATAGRPHAADEPGRVRRPVAPARAGKAATSPDRGAKPAFDDPVGSRRAPARRRWRGWWLAPVMRSSWPCLP